MRAPKVWRASSEWRKAYYRKRIAKYIDYLGGKCVKCGSRENLQFDHVDANTKCFEITTKYDSTWDVIKPELTKCQLLCSDCHQIKGRECGDIPPAARHGSLGMYRYCRCIRCKQAWNEYHRKLKKKLKDRKAAIAHLAEHRVGISEVDGS